MDSLIVTQIKNSCPCFCDKDDNDVRALIMSLISLLSVSLCWNDTLCGTFLYGLRSEEFDYVPDCLTCQPCTKIKEFPLFYRANQSLLDIVDVTIHIYNGLDEVEYALTPKQYKVRKGVLLVDTTDLPSNCCTCSCDQYAITVNYMAGYKELPDCLLPLFCDLLVTMSLSLTGCGSIDECCTMTKPKAYQIIKNKKIGELSYTWTVDQAHTSYIYEQMANKAKLARIAQLSCCGNDLKAERLWYVQSC